MNSHVQETISINISYRLSWTLLNNIMYCYQRKVLKLSNENILTKEMKVPKIISNAISQNLEEK